jgi:hypothetical protein
MALQKFMHEKLRTKNIAISCCVKPKNTKFKNVKLHVVRQEEPGTRLVVRLNYLKTLSSHLNLLKCKRLSNIEKEISYFIVPLLLIQQSYSSNRD